MLNEAIIVDLAPSGFMRELEHLGQAMCSKPILVRQQELIFRSKNGSN